jgi:hypothetical protein
MSFLACIVSAITLLSLINIRLGKGRKIEGAALLQPERYGFAMPASESCRK